jgi:phosphate:Na+ symporter
VSVHGRGIEAAARDIKRLNDHLVAGAAYPSLEASGALLASRISDASP